MSGSGVEAAIDRVSSIPYYNQLADRIRDRISAGTIAVGERLPSEGELATSWNLSRATVREALRLLEEHGWVSRIARRGAFATMPPQRGWLLHGREGFFENESRRHRVTTAVLRAEQTELPRFAAEALQLPPGSAGYVLERVRALDGNIALYSINYLPSRIGRLVALSDVPTGTGSLNATMHQAGYDVAGASRTVEAVTADGTLAQRLDVPTGAPLLKIKSTSWNSDLVVFDHHEVWVRSDVVHVEIQVGAPAPAHHPSPAPEFGRIASP
ncbi:GntR family transcriptional regulator [Paractinoplanes abujensis]|uniref:GntR family transcriptional regulator n=1 Tax=Paractinoplanes abujensis TaxID=882441 RepID=A0A7W7CU14_9ACTN|nr:GntR family transcriptional regulator [Actinoplanes abujensis]MBB4693365.1 GntR family transcriptional regulator [Actinoplanes abujensis]GID24569.1 GntR family transcriptional regulator [Actinoplanes abujensis]